MRWAARSGRARGTLRLCPLLQLPVAQQAQAQATANLLAQERTQQRANGTGPCRLVQLRGWAARIGMRHAAADESAERSAAIAA